MGLELLICGLLASVFMSARPISDFLHLLKGQEPPHVTKAKLRAERERERLAAERARLENRRVRLGEDKPTFGDLLRVYWGDAMADAIAAHERRRAEKRAQRAENEQAIGEGREPVRMRPALRERAKRIGSLLWNGKPTAETTTEPVARADAEKPRVDEAVKDDLAADGPVITCDACGAKLIDRNGGWDHPVGSDCPEAGTQTPASSDNRKPATVPAASRSVHPNPTANTETTGPVEPQTWSSADRDRVAEGRRTVAHAGGRGCGQDGCTDCVKAGLGCGRCGRQPVQHNRLCRWCRYADAAADPDTRSAGQPLPGQDSTDHTEENTMTAETATAPTATGDAHDVESALHECSLLDDDLDRINTALDTIDTAIDEASQAAERIEAFLASKNVDDSAVGGMATARDMLSPDRIKELMDAVGGAKQGVKDAMDELTRLQELEQQLAGADGSVLNGR